MTYSPTNRSASVTRMPHGVTNAHPFQTMGNAGYPDPTWSHLFEVDFDQYVAADWSLTGTGGTAALIAGDGGILQLSVAGTIGDAAYLQKTPAAFSMTAGHAFFFKTSVNMSSTGPAFYAGIADIGSGAEGSLTDGIVIYKAAAATSLSLQLWVGGVNTASANFPATCTVTAATALELGIVVDVYGNILAYWNPTTGGTYVTAAQAAAGTYAIGPVAQIVAPTLPTTNMAPIIGYTNNAASAVTCNVDYIVASKDR
jgi:hypothetical protein